MLSNDPGTNEVNLMLGYLTPNEFEVLHSTQPQATLS